MGSEMCIRDRGKKTKHTVLCYCVSSQLTLAAPRLGAEEGVGRTTKKSEHEKTTVPCLCLAARLPRPWPRTEWGGRRDGKKANRRAKRNHPGPSTERGGGRKRKKKKNARTKLPSPITQETLQTLTLKFRNTFRNPRRKYEDLKTQKAPGTTQRENADPKTRTRPGATQGVHSNPITQKLPEVVQGGEPKKPENCRARRRRESELITAAPLESSTLRWTHRENALDA